MTPCPAGPDPVAPPPAGWEPAELALAEARRWVAFPRPADGWRPRTEGAGPSAADGTRAAATGPGGPAAELGEPPAGGWDVGGLPTGTAAVAAGRALAVAALAAARSGVDVEVDAEAVLATLLLPLVVATATGTPPAARPPDPLPTGEGAVCADLSAEGDREAFERLVHVLGPGPWAAETLAARAQEWRLPVTPYRRRPPLAPRWPSSGAPRPPLGASGPANAARQATRRGPTPAARRRPGPSPSGWPPLAGVTVVDLTAMWSGPLCTALLAALGARVVKVEPECRPDGTRSSPGGALFRALNGVKEIAPLDLRRAGDRADFLALVAGADLVVDNFSPRVTPNLGIDPPALRRVRANLLTVSLPAFGPGPERHWVSYGTGVHAVSGLGHVAPPVDMTERARCPARPGRSTPYAAPVVTYPDPLAGLAGAAAALALLARRDGGGGPGHAEVPLLTALTPLPALADDGSLSRPLEAGLADHLAHRFGPVPPAPFRPRSPGSREAAIPAGPGEGGRRGR